MNELLQTLQRLRFPHNDKRQNVLQEGQTKYEGFVLGHIRPRGSGLKTGTVPRPSNKTTKPKYERLFEISKKVMKAYDPNFYFTSIQYNKNQQCAKHKDAHNVNDSYIIGLGDYTGGELRVWNDETTYTDYDIQYKFFRFDGSKHFHETCPFEGERYTLVFYSI